MLGSINNTLPSVIEGHDELYLGITVGNDIELSPRVPLSSVPYSMQALTVPDGSVTTDKIADGAVSSDKIASGNVTTEKIANGAITSGKLALTTVTAEEETDVTTQSTTDRVPLQEVSINLDQTSKLLLLWQSHAANQIANCGGDFWAYLDGSTSKTPLLRTHFDSSVANLVYPVSILGVIESVAPGTHTIEIRWNARGCGTLVNWSRHLSVVALGQ